MTLPDLKQLEAIVKPAAHEILVPGFGKIEFTHKADGSIITAADRAMQSHLVTELQKLWPDYAILGEEMTEEEQRTAMTNSAGYWCIDPLDGTNNYATGMPFFAVSIALIVNNQQVLGFIYDPAAPDKRKIRFYVNGAQQTTYVGEDSGDQTVYLGDTTNFPGGEEMNPGIAIKMASGSDMTVTLRRLRCVQLL